MERMKNFKFFTRCRRLFLFAIIFPFCFIDCKNNPIEQEDEEYNGNSQSNNFILLYSTLGYEANGTKKSFVRSKEYINPHELDTIEWKLVDQKGEKIIQGELAYSGISFGIQMWEADFSSVKQVGKYKIEVLLTNKQGNIKYNKASLDFYIQDKLFTNHILFPLTIYNAEARIASQADGGGYYDCNTPMGEAYSHGIFLNGIIQTYLYEHDFFSQNEEKRFVNAANIAFDYLVNLHNNQTGEFIHSYHTRPNANANLGIRNTQEALYGFSTYLDYFKQIDSTRANEKNYQKAVKSVIYLENTKEWGLTGGYEYQEYLIPIYYHLYQYSGDVQWKRKAVSLLNSELIRVDIKNMIRYGARAIPVFEGLYLLCKAFPDDPDYDFWMKQANQIKDKYYLPILEKNSFNILPISEKEYAAIEWDDNSKIPMGEGSIRWLINTFRASSAMDACFLGELTQDNRLEKIAAGEIGYIMGLNPGLPGGMIRNPETKENIAAASFIHNLDARFVSAWTRWDFRMKNNQWMSISNGFTMKNNNYIYIDDWVNAETFIKTDGAFAYAMCVYEKWCLKIC